MVLNMIDMIKAEIKRLYKSKGFYIATLIFVIAVLAFMQLSYQSERTVQSMSETGIQLSITAVPKTLNSYVASFGISFGVLVMGIYLSGFVCQEYSTNFIKNTVTQKNGRVSVVLSKTVIALLFSITMIVLSYIVSWLYGSLLLDNFMIESITEIIKTIVLLFFINMAIFSLVIFIATLSKNQAIGIIILFLVASGMLLPVLQNICQAVNMAGLATYTLSYFFDTLLLNMEDMYLKIILMCTFYIFVYNTLGILILKKRNF